MRYWINLFTWHTWQEFLEHGGNVSGFKERRWRTVQRIQPGDTLICYMTGVSRFYALLDVTGNPYKDRTPIWGEDVFPCRVPVQVMMELEPEYAVPVMSLRNHLSYFQDMKAPNSWTGHFRGSPIEEKAKDAQIIIAALEEAQREPISQAFDPRKLDRKVPVYDTEIGAVTVPENEHMTISAYEEEIEEISHEEIQWRLLDLGSQMGLDVWVARNDRNKSYQDNEFSRIPRLRGNLPRQFDEATHRTIELIDVLWLKDNAIVAAFEVEHTTSIYSGLLRMSDLVSMQPNLNIRLYIVAPDERRDKVFSEINRQTFSKLKPSLTEICQYIPYSALKSKLQQAATLLRHLRPEFLEDIAETFEPEPL